MGNLKALLTKTLSGGVILLFLFLGVKSCIITAWLSPSTAKSYSIQGGDNRTMTMVLIPDNKAIVIYNDPNIDFTETVLMKMRGTYGTHYFWRFWRVENPNMIFGFRIYPSETKPVAMEIKILNKLITGFGDPTFPKVGDTYYTILIFY